MKHTINFILIFLLFVPFFSKAQVTEGPQRPDGFYERVSPSEREVIPYDHIRESDVFWEKRIWRVIDVDEKLNLPFKYFHQDWQDIKPLIEIMMGALEKGEITGFGEDNFLSTVSFADAIKKCGAGWDTIPKYDKLTGEIVGDTAVFNEPDFTLVKK